MTELEWLKQESGMTDEELKAMETVAGAGKFKAFLVKAVAANQQAATDKATAEQARLDLENRYQNEFVPEMRKVTTDALRATGEAARLKAELEQARQYGIVPEPAAPAEPPRAPGSPSPAAPQFDGREWAARQNRAIITLQDLNSEHFKLFGSPLSGTQELVDMVEREHTLGRKDFTLQKAWEAKFQVPEKRAEIQKAEQQKVIDAAIAADRKVQAEKHGSNPNTRTGQPSRFSNYKPTDAAGKNEPWKADRSKQRANSDWRKTAENKIREAMAS